MQSFNREHLKTESTSIQKSTFQSSMTLTVVPSFERRSLAVLTITKLALYIGKMYVRAESLEAVSRVVRRAKESCQLARQAPSSHMRTSLTSVMEGFDNGLHSSNFERSDKHNPRVLTERPESVVMTENDFVQVLMQLEQSSYSVSLKPVSCLKLPRRIPTHMDCRNPDFPRDGLAVLPRTAGEILAN